MVRNVSQFRARVENPRVSLEKFYAARDRVTLMEFLKDFPGTCPRRGELSLPFWAGFLFIVGIYLASRESSASANIIDLELQPGLNLRRDMPASPHIANP